MTKEIYISGTPHETRLAIVEDDQLAEIYYERENEYTLAGSVYKGKVTRVLPGMQSAFVDIGLERDAFLYVTDFAEEQEDGEEYVSLSQGNGHRNGRSHRNDRSTASGSNIASEQSSPSDPQASDAASSTQGAEDSPADVGQQTGSGSRRWRGRRGRRRGRGRSQQEGASSESAHSSTEGGEGVEDSTQFAGEEDAQELEISSSDRELSQQDSSEEPEYRGEPEHTDLPEAQVETRSFQPEARPVRPSSGTPFVLPGESLSKYRRGSGSEGLSVSRESRGPKDEAAAAGSGSAAPGSSAPAKPAFRPSTMVVAPIAWDGGADLPGESISSHKRHSGHSDHSDHSIQAEPAALGQTASSQSHEESEGVAEPAQPDVISNEASEIEEQVSPSPVVSSEPTDAVSASPDSGQTEAEATSASYRFDPSAPSPYRQGGVAEPEEESVPAVSLESESKSELEEGTENSEPEEERNVEQNPGAEPQSQERDPHVFDPGRGDLEEETIEEGDEEAAAIPELAADEDYDELFEETLDAQMESGLIGEVVRDRHIDRRTGFARDPDVETPAEESNGETAETATESQLGDQHEAEEVSEDAESMDAVELEDGVEVELDDDSVDDAEAPESSQSVNADRAPSDASRPSRRGVRERRFGHGGDRHHRMRRSTAQTTNLPAITELLKPNQEILVQIAKEPIARKGARITSHIALPGRFMVFMPTVNHVGVSRKISSDEERQRLKRILISEKGDAPGGFIVRTAAASANEDDLRADIRFLLSLWAEIRQRADSSKPPALIYHDLSLVERVLRDRVTEQFSAVWVDSEQDYERVLRFLNRFEPALVRRVKLYTKETPLFEQFGIQEEINKALRSKVWLKSGGSIVINQTEALVAIDINTGKYVGKTARLEDTILKTNLDAIPEIVRQIRLRDLGGIIVIDFIDMDERRNRNKVMQALEEALKLDRAPSKVLQFNDFGLVAITRKRVKQSLERTLSVPCFTCGGTGMVKAPLTVCNEIYVELRKMHRQLDRGDILLRVNPEVVKQLKASNGRWLAEMEEMSGKTIIVKSDAALPPDQFDIQ